MPDSRENVPGGVLQDGLPQPQAPDANAPPAQARIDAIWLQQALACLILNATQAAKACGGSEAAVTITVSSDTEHTHIDVVDNGAGIQLDSPFQLGTTSKTNGLGVGLRLTQHLIRAMGGTVSLTSVAPRGTRARISLQNRS